MNIAHLLRLLVWIAALSRLSISAATIAWNNPAGGSWNVPTNWTPAQVPGPSDTAVIQLAGTYTVDLASTVTLTSLELGGPGASPTLALAAGILTVSQPATIRSGAVLSFSSGGLRGPWSISPGGRLDLATGAPKTFYATQLLNLGTLRWLAGSVSYDFTGNTSTFTNAGLWEIHADSSWSYPYGGQIPSLRNEGTLRKVGGIGTSTLLNLNFDNAGQIQVDQGRLALQSINGFLTGSANVAQGAILALVQSSLTNAGPVSFTGAGKSVFESGSLWLGGALQPSGLLLAGGTLHLLPTFQGGVITNLTLEGIRLNGTNQVAGSLVVSNAALAGRYLILPSGRLDLVGNATKQLYDTHILNRGTVRWLAGPVSYDFAGNTSTFTNAGLWEIHADTSWSYPYSGQLPSLRNEGILRKVGGAGTSTLLNLDFVNAGQIQVDQGRLSLQSINGLLTGSANVAQGATLSFLQSSLTNAGFATFTGPGKSVFESGNLWLDGAMQPAGLQLVSGNLHLLPTFQGGVITNLTLEGIRLNGTNQVAGSLVVSNASLAGRYLILPSGRLDLVGNATKQLYDTHILNRGTVRWLAGPVVYDFTGSTSTFTNVGLWEIHADTSWSYPYSGQLPSLRNEGILRKVGGPGTSTLLNLDFVNAGQIQVDQGRLALQSINGLLAGSANVAQGATLSFLQSSLTNAGLATFTGPGKSVFESGNLWLDGSMQPAGLLLAGGNLHLLPTFQGGVITNLTLEGIRLNGTNQVAGSLVVSNASLAGRYHILPSGRLDLVGNATKQLFDTHILNQGSVRWLAGPVVYDFTGNTSTFTNAGLWEIHADTSWSYPYSGLLPSLRNEGTLRKVGGPGTSTLLNLDFVNAGQIQVDQGRLSLQSISGLLAGSANVAQGATLAFVQCSLTNAGPTSFTGPGKSLFESGSLWLSGAAQPPGLQLAGGTLRLLPDFQGGSISNLILQGIVLSGTNRVQGLLVASNSPLHGGLVIQPGGRLDLTGTSFAANEESNILNLGTVRWLGGNVTYGGLAENSRFTNAGLFEIHGDNTWYYPYSGPAPIFRNQGIVRKLGGAGNSTFQNLTFENPGVIEAATGSVFLPPSFNLTSGILRPTGGTIGSQSLFNITGGTIEGSGTIQGANFVSGLISPGGDATGDLRFPSGLTLTPDVTVRIHATGTSPGTQHDRIRVTGPVNLGGASLDFATANGIGFGQSILFLENDGVDPISGSFANRFEGSLFDVGPRLYRIRYKTGTGNDASLIRDDGAIVLTPLPVLTNGVYRVLGLGTNFVHYRIEASTNLTDWIELGTVPANGGGEFQFDDPDTATFPHRLYRAVGP